MDTAKWPQEFVVKPMNEIVTNTCLTQPTNPPPASSVPAEKKTRPEKDLPLNCPRCNSLNTKFCYYNNYSLTQPRYFCKDCRRYWTEGGSLRNIPIGGGIRKNKRSASSPSSSSKKPLFVNNTPPPPPLPQLNPKIPHEPKLQELGFGQVKDLNLAFSQGFGIAIPEFLPTTIKNNNPSLVSTSSALELLGISTSSSTRPPPPLPFSYDSYTSSGFGLTYPHQFQEFMRPSLGFSLDAAAAGYPGDPSLHQQQQGSTTTSTNNGRPLLQFESLKLPVSSSSTNSGNVNDNHLSDHEHDDDKDEGAAADQSAGFWNGMLSAGAAASASGSWQ